MRTSLRPSSRRGFRLGVAVLGAAVLAALLAPWLAPADPAAQIGGAARLPPLSARYVVTFEDGEQRLAEALRRDADGVLIGAIRAGTGGAAGSRRLFVLGTDDHGRDVWSRLLHGARLTFLIAFLSIAMAMTVGVAVGALAALGGRLLDSVLMRAVDGLLAFPWLFLLIALRAILPVSGVATMVLIIGGSGWLTISRLTRAELLALREREFVLAARASGAGPLRILRRHLLPHAMTPLLVQATLGMAAVIAVEAALSFLGYGVPGRPSWGGMIDEGQSVLFSAWWISTFPALALSVTMMALGLVGDGLRDVLDPRNR